MCLCLALSLRRLEKHSDITLKAPAYILIGHGNMQRSKLETLARREWLLWSRDIGIAKIQERGWQGSRIAGTL